MEENDWSVDWTLDVHKVRALYDVIHYTWENWPGYPARPKEEQEFLISTKSELFAMLMDYTFKTKNQ